MMSIDTRRGLVDPLKGNLQLLPFGCAQGKTPAPMQQLANHIGEVARTRQARCDKLDPEGKSLAFAGKGFRT
ncbi:hypothetical protein H5410_032711 [Solanum commersonii]|uniref:Uncharacterized protein n=1 Tax=Solanum commersonii TaxID=4109 RepID=A0A9J5YN17_SOLCO|nr:hypothetical protein H5410_032711 [Solanum commersonii]